MIRRRTRSEEETAELAAEIARRLSPAAAGGGVLVGLSGELGAGKTAFTRGFVRGIDPERARRVTSPTFAIAQVYAGQPEIRHLDLYRLSTAQDLEAIGWRDLYFAPGLVLVEWIERVPEVIPAEWVEIRLAVDPSDVRDIAVIPHGERLAALLAGLES